MYKSIIYSKTPIIITCNELQYDITNFINEHPGGASLLANAHGCDLTEVIQSYHSSAGLKKIVDLLVTSDLITYVGPIGQQENYKFSLIYKKARDAVYNRNFSSWDPYDILPIMFCLQYVFQFALTSNWVINGIINGLCLIATLGYGHQFLHIGSPMGSFITFGDGNSQMWIRIHALGHHPYTNTARDQDLTDFKIIDGMWFLPSIVKFMVVSLVIAFRPYVQCLWPPILLQADRYDNAVIVFNYFDICARFGPQWLITRLMFSTWFLIIDYFNHYHKVPREHASDDWATQQILTTQNFVFSKYLYKNAPFIHSIFTFGLDRQIEHHLFPKIKIEHLYKVTKYIPSQHVNIHYFGLHSLQHIWNHFAWV